MTIMSAEENKEVIRRFVEELWNERHLEAVDEIFDRNCITHQLRPESTPAGSPRDPDSIKREMSDWLRGFPDLKFTIERMVAEDDVVVTHCTITGTNSGSWSGTEPTGRKVNAPIIVVHRLKEGKIVEDWVLVGALNLFQQLGYVPPTDEILAKRGKISEQE